MRCGGHFDVSSVLYFKKGAGGKGALLAGDTIMVAMNRKSVSFMYSYPNLIPLSANKIRKIVGIVKPYEFDRDVGAEGYAADEGDANILTKH